MTALISFQIWLGVCFLLSDEPPVLRPPQQSLRVFADTEHKGNFIGPLTATTRTANDFGIVVPLPSGSAGRDRWPEKFDAVDPMVERLGRVRIETTPGAGDVVVSIEIAESPQLAAFSQGSGHMAAAVPAEDRSWTVSPGKDGLVEVGVALMIPEARGAATRRYGRVSSPSRSR